MALLPKPKPIHALFFPFPAIGHINPLLQLASYLCSGYGVKVTFLMTEYHLSQVEKKDSKQQLQEDDPLFSFYCIPDGLASAESYESVVNIPKLFMAMLKMAESGVLEAVMKDLQGKGTPVECIVSDTFFSTWTQAVADMHGIPRLSFWISSASAYLIYHYTPRLVAQGRFPLISESNGRKEMVEIPGICPLPVDKLPSELQVSDTLHITNVRRWFEDDKKCAMLIMNSHVDLEGEQLKVLQENFNSVAYVGPLLPPSLVSNKPSSHGSDNRIKLSKEKHNACLDWLLSKPACSVLYVSFGTI